jgi:hypothetical protein
MVGGWWLELVLVLVLELVLEGTSRKFGVGRNLLIRNGGSGSGCWG